MNGRKSLRGYHIELELLMLPFLFIITIPGRFSQATMKTTSAQQIGSVREPSNQSDQLFSLKLKKGDKGAKVNIIAHRQAGWVS